MMRMNIGNLKGDKSTIARLIPTRLVEKHKTAKKSNSDPVFLKRIYLYSVDNPVIKDLMKGNNVMDRLKETDDEIELEFAGKSIDKVERIILDSNNDFVYSYEIIERILGNIPSNFKFEWRATLIEKKDGYFIMQKDDGSRFEQKPVEPFYFNYFTLNQAVYCFKSKNISILSDNDSTYYMEREFRFQEPNINVEKNPLRVTEKMIDITEFVDKFVIKNSYQLIHVDNLAFDFFYEIAQNLSQSKKVASLQFYDDLKKKWTDNIVLKKGDNSFKMFLEGRVDERNHTYTLLVHLSEMELRPLLAIRKEVD